MKPWNLYPLDDTAGKIALAVMGYSDAEQDDLIDRALDPIKADLIAKGFTEQEADDWCVEIAAHIGAMQADLALAGCWKEGRA